MDGLLRAYGRWLGGAFVLAAAVWAVALILAPQVAVVRDALTVPARKLDSTIAEQVATDAADCRTILERQVASPAPGGFGAGIAVPRVGGAGPAIGTPAIGGAGGGRPYVIQCERADTMARLVRDEGEPPAFLAAVHGLDVVRVDPDAAPADRKLQADRVRAVAEAAAARLREVEAKASPYGLVNFEALFAARQIPLTDAAREADRASLSGRLQRLVGLRFEREGEVFVRIGLATLVTTLWYAALATVLSLAVCYPIAYRLALVATGRRAAWLLLGLLVPYAVIELMRVYAWLSLVENRGAINIALQWLGVVGADSPIEFKRHPLTVFVVIVYSYILFMMFPLINVLSTLDRSQIEAARDLGAGTVRIHARVVIPHAKPGIAVGCIATFMLAAGAFSVPQIISRGLQGEWFAQSIYVKFFESGAVNQGAAYAFVFTAVCFALIALFMRATGARLSDFVRG
jgi:spermidine/putrescine transport system permease protein